jgi:hypothetical protein
LNSITITVILKKEKRTPQDIAQVTEIARSMGLEPRAKGLATVSLRASSESIQRIFGVTVKEVPPLPPSASDAGAPGGMVVEDELPVPNELTEYVVAISVIPPARRL